MKKLGKKFKSGKFKKKPAKVGTSTLAKVASVANTALRMGKFVASIVNAEKKYYDTFNSLAPTLPASIVCLSNVTVGSGPNQRNGITVKLDGFYFQSRILVGATRAPTQIRQIIFMDNEQDGSPPTQAEVLQSTLYVTSPLNVETGGRFRILDDKYFNLHDMNPIQTYKKYYNFSQTSTHLKFLDTTGLTTGIGNNAIYILVMSDQVSGGGNVPQIDINARIRYYDN